MTPERLSIIKETLNKRQPDLTVIMENVGKLHNLAAVARTLEALGGMEIHASTTKVRSMKLSQMSAGGVRKWIPVKRHDSIQNGISHLKQRGFQIVGTCLNTDSKDYREVDYTKPTAVLVGEELEGLTWEAQSLADHSVLIPMVGMVQSLNVSVATALVLYEAYRQRESSGLYDECRLDSQTYEKLLFEACHPQVTRYCKQKNIPYPAIDENAEFLEPVADSTTWSEDGFSDWMRKKDL